MKSLTGQSRRRACRGIGTVGLLSSLGLFAGLCLAADPDQVTTHYGTLTSTSAPHSAVRVSRGIPFAAPPIGTLRWKPPQAPANWTGVRRADSFGPRCMQAPVFDDMVFRSGRMSEDCLYLNVWTPPQRVAGGSPVLVYFYGGGFVGGDASEPRYDGENLARRGIIVVTVNYRLGVFGFLAHPELSRESSYHGSGNYGLLDQEASLKWVHENIAAFGGDPHRVTIGGESAGSISVSALMASPLSRGLISGVIGESGSIIGALPAAPLAAAEANGQKFSTQASMSSLADLRALSADKLLALEEKFAPFQFNPPSIRFTATVDGYFLPKAPAEIFAAGEQAHVPLLAGSNSEEMGPEAVLGDAAPTLENYRNAVRKLYGTQAEAVLRLYPAAKSGDSVLDAAQALAGDRFIGYGTFKWVELATATGGKPTFYYYFSRSRPRLSGPPSRGALHSAEIEYVLGNLARSPMYKWTSQDRQVSKVAQDYFVHFIEAGDPNAPGLPDWPAYTTRQRMNLDVRPRAMTDQSAARGHLFDNLQASPQPQ